jgi:tetratricopeptide (TPR) repeat protein
MKYFILILGFIITSQTMVNGQDPRLCEQYFRNGEYDKASICFQKVFEKNPSRDYYFDRYIETLLLSEQYKDYEKQIKKRIKKYPQKVQLYVSYGEMFERQFEQEKANKQYRRAISNLPANRTEIIRLSQKFIKLTKYDFALESYKKGSDLLKDKAIFAYELGDLYRQKGDRVPMIENYIVSLKTTPTRLNSLKTIFQRFFGKDDFKELQLQLYQAINDEPDQMVLLEMMSWVFIQKKDYKNAFRQVKAIDKRTKDTGGRVYRLAQMAQRAKDYDAAIKAYEYLVEEKGRTNTYYIDSKKEMLKCKRLRLVDGYDYTKEDLKQLEAEYETFLTEFGKNATSGNIVYELAELEAFYLNDLEKAIGLLDELIETPGVRRHLLAESKLALGDYYLMDGEIWESTLLYSQVDKGYKDDVLGQRARFKNAKLSYFKGDFEWAQTQFSVLKASTSKLIANDALDLSVFILDNLALDTVILPMYLFSQAELLIFQNRFDDAFVKMDSIIQKFPNHSLQDDIYFAKAAIYKKQRKYDLEAQMYQNIIDNFKESIRVDNSLFALAGLYERHLNDKEKAQKLYEQIILDFSNSTFAVEARKRFRELRGDFQ